MGRTTRSDALARILTAARKDPQFFHDLVFSPKKAIAKAPFLDRATRTRLTGVRAGYVIAGLLGRLSDCGNDKTCSGSTCSGTCGSDSCQTQTCGGGSCSGTCSNSCSDTITPPKLGRLADKLDTIRWKLSASGPRVVARRLGRTRPGR